LIALGPDELVARGMANRAWMEQYWSFSAQWTGCWQPSIETAIGRLQHKQKGVITPVLNIGQRSASRAEMVSHAAADSTSMGEHFSETVMSARPDTPVPSSRLPRANASCGAACVSVVIPHGGKDRLPLLAATLASLRQAPAAAEIIVVELGPEPVANDLALRWADAYVFIEHSGAFERATALNAGTAVASHELVAWHDNDLLHAPGFLERAAAELASRSLDTLVPYSAVHYLDAADSLRVRCGDLAPADATVVNTIRAAIGCIGLVRRDFVLRHGGMIEGFRGWGGEDDAWLHKAAICGRMGVTKRTDQIVYHLHHPLSGGIAPGRPGQANPHYAANVARLAQVRAASDAQTISQRFAPPPPATGNMLRRTPRISRASERLPVWTYWEGPCPAWIRACRRTLLRHAPSLRLLTPQSFEEMRADDPQMRGLDLSHMHVAHRADVIRAWQLARFGGLWIDADCLLMRPVRELEDWLAEHEFIGHRMRNGPISNSFIAARAGSRIATAYWERLRDIAAKRWRVGWNLGGDILTTVVQADSRGWHEIPFERVQPVCWSCPQEFLTQRDPAAHDALVDPEAIAYMLSNVELGKRFPQSAGRDALMSPRSFFAHLLTRSLGDSENSQVVKVSPAEVLSSIAREDAAAQALERFALHGCESVSGTGSSLAQTDGLRRKLPLLLEHLGVRRLLDAPCGDRHWIRTIKLPGIDVVGVDILAELARPQDFDGESHFVVADLLADAGSGVTIDLPQVDAILCRDLLVHLPYAAIGQVMRRFAATGAKWLITTHFTADRVRHDISPGGWRPICMTSEPFGFPPPHHLIVEGCTENEGAFADKSLGVWRFCDLMQLPIFRKNQSSHPSQRPQERDGCDDSAGKCVLD
jgi:hypothetical protein